MLSSVFLMQSVGQALAQMVGVLVLLGEDAAHGIHEKQCGINSLYEEECKKIIDGTWRIVIGSGAVPALLAIIFRFFLYDCGLYTLEVKNKPGNAFRDTQRVYGAPAVANGAVPPPHGAAAMYPSEPTPVQFSLQDLYNFLVRDKNWYYLLGTSMTWFFLDVSFYGFSLDNRGTLADLWATTQRAKIDSDLECWESLLPGGTSLVPSWLTEGMPVWQTDVTRPCNTIYQTIIEQTKQYLITVSLASIAGSVCFIFFANRIPRRQWLTTSFLILTLLFLVTGGVYYGVAHTPGAPATVVCVAVCHFMFNFGESPSLSLSLSLSLSCPPYQPQPPVNQPTNQGANTLTFIIPAEIFPTCYRCTCHGIAAAAGKLGSIFAVLIVYGINAGYDSRTRQGLIFILFATFMALGALYSWAYLPDVQRRRPPAVGEEEGEEEEEEEEEDAGASAGAGAGGSSGGALGVMGMGMGAGMGMGTGTGAETGEEETTGPHRRRRGRRKKKRRAGLSRLETRTLEELGEGYMRARQEGQLIGLREKWADLRERLRDQGWKALLGPSASNP